MRCEHCGERDANVHITQMTNGETTQLHLCEQCAAQIQPVQPMSVQELFSHLTSIQKPPELRCEQCGCTWAQFQRTSFLGCPHCYEAFAKPLQSTIEAIQGSTVHRGRRPEGAQQPSVQVEMENMRIALQQAIDDERYEEAARLRDLLREKEKEVQSG